MRESQPHKREMRNHTNRRPRRFGRSTRRRGGRNGRYQGRNNGGRRGTANGNVLRKAGKGEGAVCIKCGHPAPDGKLCVFHRQLLNTFRKEIPDQDPRRFRF